MSTMALSDVPQVWREFLIDVMFAENYELGHLDDLGPSVKNPVVERLLPSLLHIKAVAILDHAISSWCDDKGLVIPKKPYGPDLKGRIDYLVDNAFLFDRSSLHAIRGTRNIVAHEPADAVDWRQLDSDVKAIHVALKELGLVGEFPKWEISSERSAAQDPWVPNALCTFDYRITIKYEEKLVAEITWSKHLMRDGA
jgi:hypothetical protein